MWVFVDRRSVYGAAKSMRSLARRIVVVCKPRYRTCPLYVGRCEGASVGHPKLCIDGRAYTQDIGNFV